MIITTSDLIDGKTITPSLGLVMASSVRARNIGRDLMAVLRNIAGGEVHEYSKLLAESLEQAVQRMAERAEAMGANGVIALRFTTSAIMGGASEILAYGTAVVANEEAN